MKTLQVLGRTVSIDITKLSKGLCAMHEEDEEMKTILAFGMLDAKLCELFEKQLSEAIKKQFSDIANELFKERITVFIKDCNHEVTKGVYSFATMVV